MPNDLNDPGSLTDATDRPLQLVDWKSKNREWYKKNVEFCIRRTNFNFGAQTNGRKDLRLFYEVYNNQFPLDWFSHITDPLSARKAEHKAFPAKIRPVTILRNNIDLLLGEYPRRPFVYNVQNMGEDGYSSYMDGLHEQLVSNLTDHFIQKVLQAKQEQGEKLSPEQLQQLQQQPPLPEEIEEEFHSTYKDALCIKAQKWLKRQLRDRDAKKKLHRMFKDWLIAGQCYSYKGVRNDELEYIKISPLNIDFDKSQDNDFIEDGEWVVARYLWTLSDIVDRFYEDLSKSQQEWLEQEYWTSSPMGMYEALRGLFIDPQERNKIPVFHVQWKGRKKIGFLSYLDLDTFQYVEEVVDENYVVDRDKGEQVEWVWVNEVYEGWRLGKNIFTGMQPVPVQRNELNNHSRCKLNYNGRKYSDTHSENISLLEIGIPFQIMYIIVTYILEKTIAKSKGKILLIDQNAIPDDEDWDEEKFFYYADALGYGLLNRNQIGVDKTWNQYQVVDLSLFEQIKQLIELQNYFKQQWDDITGINRQRKGETYASDGQGVNERATFQSTVMTDMIFIGFEEFAEKELQGFIDFMPFLTSKGEKSVWVDDDLGTQLMEIFPEDFSLAQLGVFISDSSSILNKLEQAKGLAQAMAQNQAKPSAVLEILDAENMADLKRKMQQLEAIEQKLAEQQSSSEQEHEQAMEEIREKYLQLGKMLDREYMEAEYDRKEEIEHIKGSYSVAAFDKDNPEEDTVNAQKLIEQREKMQHDAREREKDRNLKREELRQKQQELQHSMKIDHEKLKNDRIKAMAAKKKANQKPPRPKK